jgi:tetratricopeptide (TPR) repeat protein
MKTGRTEELLMQGHEERESLATRDDEEIHLASLADPPAQSDGAAAQPNSNSRSRRASRLAILALVMVVLGPVLWRWWPTEVARWYGAIARERQIEGDMQAAEQALLTALRWNPESAALHRQRGDLGIDSREYDRAVADYTRAIDLDPTDPMNFVQRSVALQHQKRHDEAIRDWQRVEALVKDQGQQQAASVLNGLAYARALGNTELDRALGEVNQALQFGGRDAESRAAMLDTRGYIQYLRGEHQAARQDLDRAVESIELLIAARANRKSYADPRQYEQDSKLLQQHAAVMRYHRALVLRELGESELADQDLQQVRRWGHEPSDDLF